MNFNEKYPTRKIIGYADSGDEEEEKQKDKEEENKSDDEDQNRYGYRRNRFS